MEKKRNPNVSTEQKREIIEFMDNHPQLRSGKFSNEFTFKKSQALWEELTARLNCIANGANKEWRQWRKVCMYCNEQKKITFNSFHTCTGTVVFIEKGYKLCQFEVLSYKIHGNLPFSLVSVPFFYEYDCTLPRHKISHFNVSLKYLSQ